MENCKVARSNERESETRKNGSGKSAMNKRTNIAAKEPALVWPAPIPPKSESRNPMRVVHEEFYKAWEACGVFEWIALGYLALSSVLITVFAGNLSHPARLAATQVFVVILVLGLCRVTARSQERAAREGERLATKFWHFWRHWYPHLFFLFCFEELGRLVHIVNPGWEDAKLISFDYWLTGVHPALWLEQLATPARNDFFQFAYITYFTYLLIVGGVLYYRRDWKAYWATMTYSAAGYVIGYCVAMLFPIESPWFSMAGMWHSDLHGGPFTAAISFIEHFGRVRGAAFPSEHVAGSVAALWGAWKHRRWLFWTLLPLAMCMCASTIWGRYHYVADVLAGITTGTLGFVVGNWLVQHKPVEGRLKWELAGQKVESFGD
jgi:membrane-associated phospholipid phosphatase